MFARQPELRTIGGVSDPAASSSASLPTSPPVPLVVAAGLAAVEGGLLALYGVAELVAVQGGRLSMGLTTAVFFLLYGVGLVFCAWSAYRLSSWARAPIVLAQLIQLGVAWSFRGGSSTPVAAALALVAATVLVGIFHRASVQALDDEPR